MLYSKQLKTILSSLSPNPNSHLSGRGSLNDNLKCGNNLVEAINFNENNLPEWKFCTDTRAIEPNSWFVALKGNNFDGNKFANVAIEKGAKGLILSEKPEDLQKNVPVLVVKDTLVAYQAIARFHRKTLNPKVVGITGSNGKTTTKEILLKVLAQKYSCKASSENENNEIGVPKNLLKIDSETEIFIQEMGMRGLGQIAELCKTAEPDYSIITNIGSAHIGMLGSRENIAQAKAEIFTNQLPDTTSFIPLEEPLLEPWYQKAKDELKFIRFGGYKNAHFVDGEMHFEYKTNSYKIKTANIAFVSNCCAVIDLATELGLTPKEIQKGLDEFEMQPGRGKLLNLPNGLTLIDETYNANPDSVVALAESMKVLAQEIPKKSEKKTTILILGTLAELEPEKTARQKTLEKLSTKLASLVDEVIWVGDYVSVIDNKTEKQNFSLSFDTKESAFEFIEQNKEKYFNKNNLIAMKGSRVSKMEDFLEFFEAGLLSLK